MRGTTWEQTLLIVDNFAHQDGGSPPLADDLAQQMEGSGWRVLRCSRQRSSLLRLADMALTTLGRHRRYAVAQVGLYSGRAFVGAQVVTGILRWLDKPHVVTLHGGGLPDLARRRPGAVRRILRGATAVTAPSAYLADALSGLRADIEVIPNALSTAGYPFRRRQVLRPRLIWLRAFHALYDPVRAPEVLTRLLPDYPEARLAMFGRDKQDGSLEQTRAAVARMGLAEYVSLPGALPKDRVPAALDEADIFLNTALVDNTPVSVIEAMACGLCVVSTNVYGLPFLLTHEVDALLVPPGDAGAMAAAVQRLLRDPALAARLSENARHKALTFDWATVTPQWLARLESLSSGVGRKWRA